MPLSDFFGVVPEGCEVRFIDAAHGNGIFATKPFAKGDIIFKEKPLQAYNRQEAWTCGHCGKFLGDIDSQFARHLGLTRLKITSNIRLPKIESAGTTTEPISCMAGCGEMYCIQKKKVCLMTSCIYHHLLCVGQIESTGHPLYRFKQHALDNNEVFIIAAQLIARIISLWLEHGKQGRIIDFQTQFLNKFTHKLWWDMPHEDSSPEELQKISLESITLLQQAFSIPFAESKSDLEQISSLFVYEFYAKLLALLEINEIAIGIIAPLEKYRKNLDKLNPQDKITAEKLLAPVMNKLKQMQLEECADEETDSEMHGVEDGEDDDEDEEDGDEEDTDEDEVPIFPNYEGIGMFPFTAMMNHSCEPNCQADYQDDNSLVATVLTPIASGDQVFLSYVYENGPLRERQEGLKSYGFVCECPKCVRQEAAKQVPKPKKKDKQKKK